MMDTLAIKDRILAIGRDTHPERVTEMICFTDSLFQAVKEIKELREQFLAEWLGHDRNLEIGDKRYYLGHETDVKNRNVKLTLDKLLEISGGDLDRVAGCLAADAWKPGAVRALLEERGAAAIFDELFHTTIKDDVKTGKPLKRVQCSNKQFAGPRAGGKRR